MSLTRKLKPDRNVTGPLIPLGMIAIFGLTSLIFGVPVGMYITAGMISLFSLYSLYVFLRTRNLPQLVIFVYSAFLVFVFVVAAGKISVGNITGNPFNSLEFAMAYFFTLMFFSFVIVYLAATRKAKWRGREIFELAAEPVEKTGNGYTSRPRPVGKVEYSPQQIRQFAKFCGRNLIALPYLSSKNTTLVPIKMGDEYGRVLGLAGDFRDASWVNFDVDGEVSVHIAQKDYLDYREPLAFDQLCNSFGQVFIDFFELVNRGEGIRAVDRMDDLKISIFS
ncbi:MAG: hypothetical protein C3F13_02390 [Anaerolineales bacterium]|nr:MAG: hypothetical protein C3F13_02390 [Anaerolineales bacterium]